MTSMHSQLRSIASRPSRVCVVGAGYVGLTAAACLAELGHEVRCLEADSVRLGTLRSGRIPIVEPGLAELVSTHLASGRLSFGDGAGWAVAGAAVALLCVGTPPRPDGEPDLRQLGQAAREVAAAATDDVVLIVKSTVPPGSGEALELLVATDAPPGVRVRVAANPEFLRESQAVWDFFNPDRLVIGVDDPALAEVVTGLYPEHWPLLICDRRSAELVKYASNTFLAVKVSFANEVAALAETLGADAAQVLAGVGLDARIGGSFLNPGPGFGGSCLPKDVAGFIAVADSVGQPASLARAAQDVNKGVTAGLITQLETLLGPLAARRIGVLGLAFKPGTDDVRHSPALVLAEELLRRGARVVAHDPLARAERPGLIQVGDAYRAASGADALVVMTAWPEYRSLDAERLARVMPGHVVLDPAGGLDPAGLELAGLDRYGIGSGRPLTVHPVVRRPLEWLVPAEPQVTE